MHSSNNKGLMFASPWKKNATRYSKLPQLLPVQLSDNNFLKEYCQLEILVTLSRNNSLVEGSATYLFGSNLITNLQKINSELILLYKKDQV